MDALLVDILSRLGITGGVGIALAFAIKEMFTRKAESIRKEQAELTELRKSERDAQINECRQQIESAKQQMAMLETSFGKHIQHHREYEQAICGKIDKLYDKINSMETRIYERINPLCDALNRIQGFMEARYDKGK
jgi:predicted nuclease with TOPRIM domain